MADVFMLSPALMLHPLEARWHLRPLFAGLAGQASEPDRPIIDSTHLKAHRTAASLLTRGPFHAVSAALGAGCDGEGRPIVMWASEGQMSDHRGAGLLIDALPPAKDLIADRGYDNDAYVAAMVGRGISPSIPPRKNRKTESIPYHSRPYRQRGRIDMLSCRSRICAASSSATTDVHMLLGHLQRSDRHLLDRGMSPDPSRCDIVETSSSAISS